MIELPDGSGFFTLSLPLPQDHWIYQPWPEGWDKDRDCMPGTPHPILTHQLRDQVVQAARYAVRVSTHLGKSTDFDPDALVQSMVYALCGPYTGGLNVTGR